MMIPQRFWGPKIGSERLQKDPITNDSIWIRQTHSIFLKRCKNKQMDPMGLISRLESETPWKKINDEAIGAPTILSPANPTRQEV
jgi:hypothetical protein